VVASAAEVAELLLGTTLPKRVVERFLASAPALWLMSAPAAQLAMDLVLCHPPLSFAEVRAAAQPLDSGLVRMTVVAHDRRGLLAGTAGTLTSEGLSIVTASVGSWPTRALALHALTVEAPGLTQEKWEGLGARLRGLTNGDRPAVRFSPVGRAMVDWSPPALGRCLVTVRAPDQVGLLWAICQWLADHGASIEAAHIGAVRGTAEGQFVIVGEPDLSGLAPSLSGDLGPLPKQIGAAVANTVGNVAARARRLLPR
jgi:predicted amino acid-binding ACT domain protein